MVTVTNIATDEDDCKSSASSSMCISLPDNEASMISSDDEFMQNYQSDGKFLYKKKEATLKALNVSEAVKFRSFSVLQLILCFCIETNGTLLYSNIHVPQYWNESDLELSDDFSISNDCNEPPTPLQQMKIEMKIMKHSFGG